jgi:hypothetical protein
MNPVWQALVIDSYTKMTRVMTLEGGEGLRVHLKKECRKGPCPIHKRTDHHMRPFPQHWREDRYLMERICPHGVGHPDPDDPSKDRVHGCDGCCIPPGEKP